MITRRRALTAFGAALAAVYLPSLGAVPQPFEPRAAVRDLDSPTTVEELKAWIGRQFTVISAWPRAFTMTDSRGYPLHPYWHDKMAESGAPRSRLGYQCTHHVYAFGVYDDYIGKQEAALVFMMYQTLVQLRASIGDPDDSQLLLRPDEVAIGGFAARPDRPVLLVRRALTLQREPADFDGLPARTKLTFRIGIPNARGMERFALTEGHHIYYVGESA